jgi:hypothetical protein
VLGLRDIVWKLESASSTSLTLLPSLQINNALSRVKKEARVANAKELLEKATFVAGIAYKGLSVSLQQRLFRKPQLLLNCAKIADQAVHLVSLHFNSVRTAILSQGCVLVVCTVFGHFAFELVEEEMPSKGLGGVSVYSRSRVPLLPFAEVWARTQGSAPCSFVVFNC